MIQIPLSVHVIILAIVQGIAEFLPISSSGHVLTGSELIGEIDILELNIVLHFGTLLSIVVFYRKRILALLREDRRVIPLLIVGTIPAAAVGLTIKKFFPEILEDVMLAGFMFVVTGLILVGLYKMKPGKDEYTSLSYGKAFLIGVFQAIAILPGISRSGMTIFAGSYVGLKQESATTFSFLLAIPAILGAMVLEGKDMLENSPTTPGWLLVVGAAVSFGVGLVALKWLVNLVQAGRLHLFSYYLIPLGLLVASWQMYVEFGLKRTI